MIFNKKTFDNNIILFFLVSFSFFVNYYYGFRGLSPLDDFLNFNCGYRILNGDIPFKDYYSVTGPVLCIVQSFFYKIFGVSWFSLVIHASMLNVILCIVFYFYLKKMDVPHYLIILLCLGISTLGYPNNGVPGVDHHGWILSICSLFFFHLGISKKSKILLTLSPIFLFISFLIKQVPASYFLILILFLYFYHSLKNKKFYSIKSLLLISAGCLFSLIFVFRIYDIEIHEFIEQYIFLSLDLGSNRFHILNFNFLKEELSKIYFLFFLIIPLIINYVYLLRKFSENINEKLHLNFIIGLFLILISYIYELHTKNFAMSFIVLPILVFLIYQLQSKLGNLNFLNFVYSFLIFYCWVRLAQNSFWLATFEILIFSVVIFLFFIKKKKIFYPQSLLIIYFIFSTFFYFFTSVEPRMYKDFDKNHKYSNFNGEVIDQKFKNLQWKTRYNLSKEDEIKDFSLKINLLKSLNDNFIFITDYQIYNNILNLEDYSPVKYWHTNVSYPSKDSKFRLKFEAFFRNKILKNNIKFIIIDSKASVFHEDIEDYSFLKNCLIKINNFEKNNISIYQIDNLCIKSYKS